MQDETDFSVIFPGGDLKILCPTDGRRTKVLLEEFVAWTPFGIIKAPAGFETDGFSIPRALWPMIGSPWDRFVPAAVVHDYLYASTGGDGAYTRKDADRVFKWLLTALGMSSVRAELMYRGVRVGGWVGWRRHAQAAAGD